MSNAPESNTVLVAEIDSVFLSIFNEHRGRVFSTAFRLTGRRDDAEDLTAETFLQAFRSLSRFDYERLETLQPRAWLSTIVVNLWRNQCRSAARRPKLVVPSDGDGPEPEIVDTVPGVEQVAERHDDGARLAALLLQLPERQRIAIVLRYVVDLSVAEIGVVLGSPAGTVKSLISRGLAQLRPMVGTGEAPASTIGQPNRGGFR